jgi:hypothetical protein
MSKPQNPLNFYRTYSYHHILFIADGTETAEELSGTDAVDVFTHPFDSGSRYKAITSPSGNGKYIVLINGLTDSNLRIESAKWQTIINPGNPVNGIARFGTIETDGEIVITEPMGGKFFNIMASAARELGVSHELMIFGLKTLFVGHTHAGTTTVISNVKPYLTVMTDLTANFDESGGKYVMSVIGVSHGVGNTSGYNSIGDGFSFNILPNQTLEQTLMRFEAALNGEYTALKERLKRHAKCAGSTIDFDSFQEAKYVIKLDNYYKNKIYSVGEMPPSEQTNTDNNDSIIVMAGSTASIASVIDHIMKTSQAVMDEAKGNKETGKRVTFTVTSTQLSNSSKNETHFIVSHQELKLNNLASQTSVFDPQVTEDDDYMSKVGIEFDYIFSGKNIDILSFDMKMDLGMSFFQFLTVQNSSGFDTSNPNVYDAPSTSFITTGTANDLHRGGEDGKKIKQVLHLGSSMRDYTVTNKKSPAVASYNSLMSRYAAYEGVGVNLTISGNPQLLQETSQLPSDLIGDNPSNEIIQGENSTTSEQEDQQRNLVPNIHKQPGYAKVNIFMPSDSDTAEFPSQYDRFWYQGWYYIHSINNNFSGGQFTQDLQLMSIPPELEGESEIGSFDTTECEKAHATQEALKEQENREAIKQRDVVKEFINAKPVEDVYLNPDIAAATSRKPDNMLRTSEWFTQPKNPYAEKVRPKQNDAPKKPEPEPNPKPPVPRPRRPGQGRN